MCIRCKWATDVEPVYTRYHDEEWGVPLFDERKLFEMLILEGAQAGLSWITILRKRENYRKAFDGFDAEKMARYGDRKIAALLGNKGIVRNRLKVNAAVANAKACLEIRESHGSLCDYLWQFVGGRPIVNAWRGLQDIPVATSESEAMSKALRKRGFRFVGPTICYALMQAVGMVNDHTVDCFRYNELEN